MRNGIERMIRVILFGTFAIAMVASAQQQSSSAPASSKGQASSANNSLTPPKGDYECWGNGEARLLMNFTVLPGNQYRDSEGKIGALTVAPDGKVSFKGGMLDGAMPNGFYVVYHTPKNHPTFSFRSARGSEAQFCESAARPGK